VQENSLKIWRCVLDLGTHKKILANRQQHTMNPEQEEQVAKKTFRDSNVCPDHWEWEQIPLGQEKVEGTIVSAPVQYITNQTTRVVGGVRKVETRTIEQIFEETKKFMPEFGGDCRKFRKHFSGTHPAIWDEMILEGYIDMYPALLDLPPEERNRQLLKDTSVSRARFKPESDYCPYSTGWKNGKLVAVGLTQLAYSSIVQFCPGEDFSNPYTHIWCGIAEAQHKSNEHGGSSIRVNIAYDAGSGALHKYEAAAGSTDPQVVLAWLEKGGKFPGQTGKGQPGQAYSKIAHYVRSTSSTLPALFTDNPAWYYALTDKRKFKFLKK
jgi:hypothetical protein